MEYQFYTVDVFAKRKLEGNQLAVFPYAEGLDDSIMQKIAREFNYSETVFVTKNDNENSRNVRIFTPKSEIEFAGHPNIGTAMLLASIGEFSDDKRVDIVFKEKVGDVPISVFFENGKPKFAELTVAKLPEEGPQPPPVEDIVKTVSLELADLETANTPASFSCGLPFLFLQVSSVEKLRKAALNFDLWKEHLSDYWAPQIYLFTKQVVEQNSNFHARMFAPALGISEDPATGSAVAAMAGYIAKNLVLANGTFSFVVEQGFEMDRPSILEMSFQLKDGKIQTVKIRGRSLIFSQGKIDLSNS